jgi:hypothetical protein
LVLAEVSFDTDQQLDSFPKPAFAIADVTNDPVFAGGTLSQLTFADVKRHVFERGLLPQSR